MTIDPLQTRVAGLQTVTSQREMPVPGRQPNSLQDSATISDVAKLIAQSGLTFSPSDEQGSLSFSSEIHISTKELLSLQGSLRQEKYLSLHIAYTAWEETSENTQRGIRYVIDLEASFTRQISRSPVLRKEDIISFVQKLVNRLQELSQKQDTLITGILFDDDDLRELAEYDHGELLKSLYHLVESINMLVRMRQMAEHTSPDAVLLHPEREEWKGIETSDERNISFSLSIQMEEFPEEGRTADAESAASQEV